MTLNSKDTLVPAQPNTLLQKFQEDVLWGLACNPKKLESKYFYDKEGDVLFQQIMACPDYYLTSCEQEIFQHKTNELAAVITLDSDEFDLIELGVGDASKSQYLLEYLAVRKVPFTYMPIDISAHILAILKTRLQKDIPQLEVMPLHGEYFDMLSKAFSLSIRRKVVMFLGANIGNMSIAEAGRFCIALRAHLNPGDLVLIGFDLKKHPQTILNAYNDRLGITAKFNLNLLKRINRELEGNFDLAHFEHYQNYDPGTGACKSYLVSLDDQKVTVSGHEILFRRNETIYMEVSQKYTPEEITGLAESTGFTSVDRSLDSKNWFLDAFFRAV
jgi:L-histidine N-alpha-methyltransferase